MAAAAKAAAAAAAANNPPPAEPPPDMPPGGLDAPPPRPTLERELFPGESELTEDERNRWLILHFALPRTITTCDLKGTGVEPGRTTEKELNEVLSHMAWGTLHPDTCEWFAEVDMPEADPPDDSRISYAEYLNRQYPTCSKTDPAVREKNILLAAQKRGTFTDISEPGAKFRATFDQMVKCLAYSNKALVKAFDVKKPILDESEAPEDASKDDNSQIVRYGRYQVIPAFWNLLISLTKQRRRFSIVFRTFGDDLLTVQREHRLFCQGQHPCYSGQNKTQKPPPMDGQKASRDMLLKDEQLGRWDRIGGSLVFPRRNMETEGAKAPEGEAATATGVPTEGMGGDVAVANPLAFRPTTYEFPPFHAAYAGLMHHILEGANAAGIVDDRDYWDSMDKDASAGKLLLVDDGGTVAETKVQHIFFDGHIKANAAHCVDVRDVVTGEPVPFADANGVYLHRVNFYQAIIDQEYFIKALDDCELKMSKRIVDRRREKKLEEEAALLEGPDALKKLPPKEYLYQTIIPALLPALEACQRDRPSDPIAFLAFYMLRHPRGYSKTLEA